MPQMAPMSWFPLFMMFTVIFLIFSIMNFYSLSYQPLNKQEKTMKIIKTNWKW